MVEVMKSQGPNTAPTYIAEATGISGSGTAETIPRWTAATALGDSRIRQSATLTGDIVDVNVGVSVTTTSGTVNGVRPSGTFGDGGVNSTTLARAVAITPTFNYMGATRTGQVFGLYINPTNTSLPTGRNASIAVSKSGSDSGTGLVGARFFNTVDETTNTEELAIYWNSNSCAIDVVASGTGTNRSLTVRCGGPSTTLVLQGGVVRMSANGTQTAQFGTTGMLAIAANTYDIGSVASNWRSYYFGTAIIAASASAAGTGAFRLTNTQALNWRNAANSADLTGISVDASDIVQLGDPAAKVQVRFQALANNDFSFTVGEVIASVVGSAGETRLQIGDTGADSILWVGQGGTNAGIVTWNFNAVAADATFEIATYSYNNNLTIDAKDLVLQGATTSATGHVYIGGSTTTYDYRFSNQVATETVFNENQLNIDHRFEGDTEANAIVLDADVDITEFGGGFALLEVSPAALASGNNNNYAPAANAYRSVWRLSGDIVTSTITGIAAPGGSRRKYLIIINVGAQTFNLNNEDANSTAANRIITGTGANVALAADDTAILWYDVTTARWRIINTH